MSSVSGRKFSYIQLHTTIFVPPPKAGIKGVGNLPDKLLSGPVTATKGSGYDMTAIAEGVLTRAPNGQEFLIPYTQCQIAVLEPKQATEVITAKTK